MTIRVGSVSRVSVEYQIKYSEYIRGHFENFDSIGKCFHHHFVSGHTWWGEQKSNNYLGKMKEIGETHRSSDRPARYNPRSYSS